MECKESAISRLVYGMPAQEEETFQLSKESKKFTKTSIVKLKLISIATS